MAATLRFGVIGTGWITDEYVHGAMDTGLWELTAVYSRTTERGEEYAQKNAELYHIPAPTVYTSLAEFAESDKMDAVYVAAPNAFHYEDCKVLLSAGKHVICEKPLCAQHEKVTELQQLAKEHNVVFLEAIMYLHLPQRKLLEESLKKIGDITLARIDFCQRSSKLDAYLKGELPNIFNPQMETGALMDLGVYCVYPALSLFGEPDSVEVSPLLLPNGIDGAGTVTLRYPDKLVLLTYSKMGQAGANTDFQGTDGTLIVDSISRLAGIRLWEKSGTVTELYGGDEKYQLMGHEARDFYRYITEPIDTHSEYEDCAKLSVSVSKLMEQIRHKAKIHFPSDN